MRIDSNTDLREPKRQSVAIVVNTYNDQMYLPDALDSALSQSIPADEIVVVDDGSHRSPQKILRRYPSSINLICQQNRGLSAARNVGLGAVNSDFVIFLDADDRLLSDAVAAGLACFRAKPEAALVYGAHRRVDATLQPLGPDRLSIVQEHPFTDLLRGNLIGMHASVMYRSSVLRQSGGFNASLRICEDYDLYLRLAKKYGVAWHPQTVAEYRLHGNNMSRDPAAMLEHALSVLDRHGASNPAPEVREAWLDGRRNWHEYYSSIADLPKYRGSSTAARAKRNNLRESLRRVERGIKRCLPRRSWPPPIGNVKLGDLASTRPVSLDFGFDRGRPIDRFYIEQFLAACSMDVAGRVLEVGDSSYSMRFGGIAVIKQDVLHIDSAHPDATLVGDLVDPTVLPDDSFDCIIFTQTLHLIFDLSAAVQRLHAALRPGGVLLLTVPGITPVERGRWGALWFWSFTAVAIEQLFEPRFGKTNCCVTTHGNVFAATAMLHGLAVNEVEIIKLRETDTAFPVTVTLRAQKQSR